VWALFAPILPPVVWCGNGCPPYDNRECLHAVLYVLVTGIGWQMLPTGFPSDKLAQRYETRYGINWDEVLLDGSKKPAKKGGNRPARVP
jgi:transposase